MPLSLSKKQHTLEKAHSSKLFLLKSFVFQDKNVKSLTLKKTRSLGFELQIKCKTKQNKIKEEKRKRKIKIKKEKLISFGIKH